MNSVLILYLTFLIVISLINTAHGEIFEECENLEDGTFVIGKQGCKSYIYCEGEESYEGFCPSQLFFNAKDGSCAPENEVDCLDDVETVAPTEAETEPPQTTSTTLATTITTTTTAPATVEQTTRTPQPTEVEIIQPEGESTKLPETVTTIKTTPSSVTIPSSSGSVSVVSTSSPAQICPITDDPHAVILLPSENSCSEYFICYHGTPVRMVCSGQLLFDYVTSKCELPIRVNCKATTQTTPNPKTECVHNTNDYFPYPKNCNYFYKCMNGFLSLQQCPIGFGWSEEMKLCLKLDHGRCPIRITDTIQNHSWLNNVYSV